MNAIEIKNLSKKYALAHERPVLLKTIFTKPKKQEIWALKDVNLEIPKGETIGIVGENGSGKSTLLKLLAGITKPTEGSIKINGRVASLIELGAGFHPDLTGKENIYLNGTILGLSKKEIDRKLPNIIAFADIGDFIDVPVSKYSSGMSLRLGFAVAVHLDPDILLIDEVLAVGDLAFQKKCMELIQELRKAHKVMVLVSHNALQIESLCDAAMWIKEGTIEQIGPPSEIMNSYGAYIEQRERASGLKEVGFRARAPRRWGTGDILITGVELFDSTGRNPGAFQPGEKAVIRIFYAPKKTIPSAVFGIAILLDNGMLIGGPNTKTSGYEVPPLSQKGFIDYVIHRLPLLPGTYVVTAAVYEDTCTIPYDHREQFLTFRVRSRSQEMVEPQGIVDIEAHWEMQ